MRDVWASSPCRHGQKPGVQIRSLTSIMQARSSVATLCCDYIFGHAKPRVGVTGTKADLLLQRDFLSALLDHVRAKIAAGRSRDEIANASVELEGFPEHGPLIDRVLTAAYEELTPGA